MAMTSLVKMGANFIIIYFRFTFKTIFWMCLMYSSIFTWSGAGICELMILVLVVRFNHEFGTAHSSPPSRFSPRLVHFMISEAGVLSIGHWLDMVYPPPPRGNFVDHIFLEAQCLARILQHVSSLTMAALSCNSLLYTLPFKIFDK